MNRRFIIVTTAALSAVAASGQLSRAEPFPVKQEYIAIASNGQSFDDRSRKLVLFHGRRGYHIGAYAGCNHFGAAVTFLSERHYTFRDAAQTAMGCRDKNDAEKVYFDALLRTKQWRISEEKLILQGDKDVLQFEAAAKKEQMQ